jgi:type II secretory ATPase GspE/PulE/Tfp pilus assembly ATPase PilB-like protein
MKLAARRLLFPLALLALLLMLPHHAADAQTLSELGAANEARNQLQGGGQPRNNAEAAAAGEDASEQPAPEGDGAAEPDSAPEADANAGAPQVAGGDGLARSRRQGMQDKWGDTHEIYRDPRPFVSPLKLLGVILVFLFWVGACNWVNRASQLHGLGYAKWNAIMAFPGFVGLLLVMLIPLYVAMMPIYALSVLVPFIVFAVVHNKSVERHERVFTGEWFRYEFATIANKFGMKMDAEMKADYEKGPPVDLKARGAPDDRGNQANLMTARLSPGYVLVKELIAGMTLRRSERVLLDYGQESVAVRHYVDGVWEGGEPRDRESGDVMLAVMKQLANLDVKERSKKQSGAFAAKFMDADFTIPIVSQGVKTGERVMVSLQSTNSKQLDNFAALGMREKLAEVWREALLLPDGLVVMSAMPEGGLTTLTNAALVETDRLMRDIFSIEPKDKPEREIENIDPNFYDPAAGETPATLMPKLIRRHPDVYICRDFVDAESAKQLIEQAVDDKLVVTTTRAKEAAESLLRILQKKAPHREFVKAVKGALNTRLIRLLCPECKVGYEPGPEMLKKLGIPAGKVAQLFRPPTAEEAPKPCPKCGGSGYFGRTGLFELLTVDDQVREALLKKPTVETVRKAARQAGMRTLQEEGILLIAKGTTSLQELQRVMKQ